MSLKGLLLHEADFSRLLESEHRVLAVDAFKVDLVSCSLELGQYFESVLRIHLLRAEQSQQESFVSWLHILEL